MLFLYLPPTCELALLCHTCNMITISYTEVPEPSGGGAPVTQLVSLSVLVHSLWWPSVVRYKCIVGSGRNKVTEDKAQDKHGWGYGKTRIIFTGALKKNQIIKIFTCHYYINIKGISNKVWLWQSWWNFWEFAMYKYINMHVYFYSNPGRMKTSLKPWVPSSSIPATSMLQIPGISRAANVQSSSPRCPF